MNCCDAEDIKISNLIAVILRKFWIVLVVTIAFGIYGFSLVPHSNTYRSVLHINFQNHENQDITSSYSLKTYTIVMTGDQAMEDISDALVSSCDLKRVNKVFNVTDGKIVPHEIRICIAIDFSYEHQMLTVYATTSDPYISEKICNTLAENADRYISDYLCLNYETETRIYGTELEIQDDAAYRDCPNQEWCALLDDPFRDMDSIDRKLTLADDMLIEAEEYFHKAGDSEYDEDRSGS